MKNKLAASIGFIALVSLITAIVYLISQNQANKQNQDIKIAATIFPIASITESILGNTGEVIQIIPSDTSPHLYEPSPRVVQEISDSSLIFFIGAGLDNWITNLSFEKNKLVDLSQKVNLLKFDVHNSHKEGEGEHTGDYDPHYWLDPNNAKLIASDVLAKLKETYPYKSQEFESNYNNLISELEKIDLYKEEQLAQYSSRGVVTFHHAFQYLADYAGIKVLTSIEPFPGQEPTPKYLEDVRKIINSNNVKVIYSEPQLADNVTKTFEQEFDVRVLDLDPLGGSNEINSYLDLIRYNIGQIKKGFEY